ncbi:hypothetical protein QBC40DRAFT_68481 [Triangularia verruculosa]|uniref:Uncharacterized protein n=1 Tax=Triangularia verruculosa TaxID=2587418 RepID=A0AAN6XI67_9PEZI|nr:hypothetical protein QBC40DRAFT_68481 [Triangularia verruculosa]
MVTNGLLSSDDELFFDPMTTMEPTSYEFQSELSDEDGPDPIAVDEVTQPIAPPVPSHMTPTMPVAPMDFLPDSLIQPEKPPVTNGHGYDGHRSDTEESAPAKPVQIVDIEVPLPQMSEEKKAEFKYIEVPEMTPETEGYMTRRTRYGPRCLRFRRHQQPPGLCHAPEISGIGKTQVLSTSSAAFITLIAPSITGSG